MQPSVKNYVYLYLIVGQRQKHNIFKDNCFIKQYNEGVDLLIETKLRILERWILIALLLFCGIMSIIVGLVAGNKNIAIFFVSIIMGITILILAAMDYQSAKIANKIDIETEGMTPTERKAYLEEKGRLAARAEEDKTK